MTFSDARTLAPRSVPDETYTTAPATSCVSHIDHHVPRPSARRPESLARRASPRHGIHGSCAWAMNPALIRFCVPQKWLQAPSAQRCYSLTSSHLLLSRPVATSTMGLGAATHAFNAALSKAITPFAHLLGLERLPQNFPSIAYSALGFTFIHLVAAPLLSRLVAPVSYAKLQGRRARNNW